MPQLGTLGNYLVQAARESDSAVATLITTQKQSIENEQKPKLRLVSEKTTRPKRFEKKRPSLKKKVFTKTDTSI